MTRDELVEWLTQQAKLLGAGSKREWAADMLRADGEEIELLRARVAELEAAQRMRPMSEAPRDCTDILVRVAHSSEFQVVWFDGEYFGCAASVPFLPGDLAGWWPLPETTTP